MRLRMARISPEELLGLMNEGAAPMVLDARSKRERVRDPRTIPGAVAIDLEHLDRQLQEVTPGREIVLFCT